MARDRQWHKAGMLALKRASLLLMVLPTPTSRTSRLPKPGRTAHRRRPATATVIAGNRVHRPGIGGGEIWTTTRSQLVRNGDMRGEEPYPGTPLPKADAVECATQQV